MGKEIIQSKPNPELSDWLATRQGLLKVDKTTTTSGGQILDWIPMDSQTGEKIATPPPAASPAEGSRVTMKGNGRGAKGDAGRSGAKADAGRSTVEDSSRGTREDASRSGVGDMSRAMEDSSRSLADILKRTEYVRFDTGEPGPEGHVPVLRPDLSRLPRNIDLKEVFAKRGGLRVNVNRRNKQPTDPNPAGYFHATSAESAKVYGCDAWLNVWDPQVALPSSPGDDHSISQTWLQNYDKPQLQSIEAGLTVDVALNGDTDNHLFTYYTTNGYTADGNGLGGYNRLNSGWIQYHPSIFPGIRVNGSSAANGAQLELGIKFQLWQGNWWFGINNNESGPWIWIGYYPAGLFNGGLGNYAEWVSFGGEVYSALANPCNSRDQMGSGVQASGGWEHAAYQRNLHNQTDTNGGMADFSGLPEVDAAASNCVSNDYTIQCFMNSGSSWGSYQYYGGPRPYRRFVKFPTEGIWQWVDYGTMVDDGVHPWNPDFRNLLTGIVMADLAKFASPTLTKEFLRVAAMQVTEAAKGIADHMNGLEEKAEE
jgi:hypothetical protein